MTDEEFLEVIRHLTKWNMVHGIEIETDDNGKELQIVYVFDKYLIPCYGSESEEIRKSDLIGIYKAVEDIEALLPGFSVIRYGVDDFNKLIALELHIFRKRKMVARNVVKKTSTTNIWFKILQKLTSEFETELDELHFERQGDIAEYYE